jgi:hypothetical protein
MGDSSRSAVWCTRHRPRTGVPRGRAHGSMPPSYWWSREEGIPRGGRESCSCCWSVIIRACRFPQRARSEISCASEDSSAVAREYAGVIRTRAGWGLRSVRRHEVVQKKSRWPDEARRQLRARRNRSRGCAAAATDDRPTSSHRRRTSTRARPRHRRPQPAVLTPPPEPIAARERGRRKSRLEVRVALVEVRVALVEDSGAGSVEGSVEVRRGLDGGFG